MNKYITWIVALLHSVTWGQEYTLTTFQSEYIEIDNYNSLQLETLGNIIESKTFQLDFDFPYFDLNYQEVQLLSNGILSFFDETNFSIRLLTFGYDWDAVVDISDIPSDIRYKDTIVNNRKALIIQFTRMRLISDTSIEEYDSYINFQYWLYENGMIELIIGETNLDNSPVYIPGEGFYLLSLQGNIPLGPELALYHPTDIDRRYSYEDFNSHEESNLRNDGLGVVDWIPPKGWVFQFKNEVVSTNNIVKTDNFGIFPNPVGHTLSIHEDEKFDIAKVINNNGLEILRSNSKIIDVSKLNSGTYSLVIQKGKIIKTQKFIKL